MQLRFTAGAFALCAIAAACSDAPVAPTSSIVPTNRSSHSSTAAGGSSLLPNSHKYRQQTYAHASNRSGVASLTARALLAKSGVTTLEVTTGALDATTAPGSISKMQIKLEDPNALVQATYNLNGLSGGRQTTTIDGRPAHSLIQVQGNVRDIDPKRTDVVTITERVNRLPDVAVTAVTLPAESKPNTTFIVSATIAELNGDLGATTNCVLYVDGTETDRANGVWVADHDAVNCAFRTSIASEGQHTVTVNAETVSPTDWDTANNAMTKTIVIRSPEVTLHGWAGADFYDRQYGYNNEGTWQSLYDLQTQSWKNGYLYHESYEEAYLYSDGSAVSSLSFPLNLAHLAIKSGQTTVTDVDFTTPQSSWGDNTYGCQYFYENENYLYVCQIGQNASVSAGHYAGMSVYYSHNFNDGTRPDGTYYHNEYDYTGTNNQWGTVTPGFGDNAISFDIRVEGGSAVLTGSAVIPFSYTDGWNYGTPKQCYDYSYPGSYTEHYCYQNIDSYATGSGYVSF